jgi:hypothetical protein
MNKIKLLVSFLIVLFFSGISNAQVAIGTNTPSPSAQFEVYSTERGFLPPRMTSAQRDSIATPATGLLIFQTNNTAGYYYYNGTAWVNLGAMGAAGTNGTNGLNSLIKTTTEVAGANCANGGTKIETGLDVNGNGVLEVTEVNASQTKYVCNGSSNSNNIGATGFNHFFPDGFVNTVKVNHTLIATCSNSTSCNVIVNYIVPSGKNLYITSMTHTALSFCCNMGIYANGVTIFSNMACTNTITTPFIITEGMTISAASYSNCSSGCNAGCAGGGASFTGILVDKNVTVILQSNNYIVPPGQLFIKVGTSSYPTVFTSGQTVPAGTNGYIIPN